MPRQGNGHCLTEGAGALAAPPAGWLNRQSPQKVCMRKHEVGGIVHASSSPSRCVAKAHWISPVRPATARSWCSGASLCRQKPMACVVEGRFRVDRWATGPCKGVPSKADSVMIVQGHATRL